MQLLAPFSLAHFAIYRHFRAATKVHFAINERYRACEISFLAFVGGKLS